MSRISGNVEINNSTKAPIYILNRLKDGDKINYTGTAIGKLYFRTNARLNGSIDFCTENTSGEISFEGSAVDGAVVKRTGSGYGNLVLNDTVFLAGTSEFRNDSTGGISIGCLEVPDGFRMENVRAHGGITLNSSVTLVPGTRLRVEGTDDNYSGLMSWDSPITVGNFLVRFSGNGTGGIDLCGAGNEFGGVFTMRSLGNHNLNIFVSNENWREEQFIEHNLYDAEKTIEKYNNLYTKDFEKLYLEGTHGLVLYGKFADNTKIIADGSDYGSVYLQGNYDGTIKFHGKVKSLGDFYSGNDLHDGTEITYNCPNGGHISLSKSCTVEGSFTINKLSKYNCYIFGKVGDGAVINVREDYPGLLQITEDIPAGTTVNY